MRFIDWFAGIGGFSLGLTRAGHEPVAYSEIDPYCCKVYERHFPGAPGIGPVDGRDTVPGVLERIARERDPGKKSLALPEPSIIVLESTPLWRSRGLVETLHELAIFGFDAEWFTLCSCRFGTPHCRPRLFVIAYSDRDSEPFVSIHEEVAQLPTLAGDVSWPDPPECVGMAHGLPNRIHRLRALGNAVVPQVVEWIGRRLSPGVDTPPATMRG